MRSRWNDQEAAQFVGDVAQRVYTSRLLGSDSTLVLHGGGNTSVKSRVTNIFGDEEEVLFVKGSGWDLETIEAQGFSPCQMSHLLRLARLEALSDTHMALELRKSLTDVNAPMPSVEAILHAVIPAKFVDHTHTDAILSITNAPHGDERVQEIFGDSVLVLPYVMPGFRLARQCAEEFPKKAGPRTIGMLLMHHGLFTFGGSARESYERMIELVNLAEEYLARNGAWGTPSTNRPVCSGLTIAARNAACFDRVRVAELRKSVSVLAGESVILSVHDDAAALAFARRPDVAVISQQGPATPDHVIRTKRLPLLGRDVNAYADAYRKYFAENNNGSLTMLDPAPRVILDADLGLCTVGRTAKDAVIVEDIYRHTMEIIERATALGAWNALPSRDIFEVEYWDLEQAKLRKHGKSPVFTGEVALITGAASGIGKACVVSLLARGAAVVGLDIDAAVADLHAREDYLGIVCDLTNEEQLALALDKAVRAFGGLDMLILNAGIFPPSKPIAELSGDIWRTTMSINLDSNLSVLRECYPLVKRAPREGRIVIIGSKNVLAPGPGAAAYSSSKAALQQLARVATLEWGPEGIRLNTLHPNGVFDTGIWTEEVLEARARAYNMSVDDYKANNLLKIEVKSCHVSELAAELCGPTFSRTTGAQISVDGGNARVV
jgi:rhamnose utilization protein RhaD (predicted bifunctional aldolase and dehydrogenase)/NAD(P)-dependent dehydrogenase (short-subunit alcohol dehydrogenase family)